MNANTNKKQVAIVTGASSGIGLGITRALLKHGYRVVATSGTITESRGLKPSTDLVLVDGDIAKQKSGHIVSISTVLVDQPLAGAHISLPVITKSTIPAFSRALVMEYVADGIRANTISPGVVDTPMHANDDHEALKKLHPIPRLVQISEIVDALLYSLTLSLKSNRAPQPSNSISDLVSLKTNQRSFKYEYNENVRSNQS